MDEGHEMWRGRSVSLSAEAVLKELAADELALRNCYIILKTEHGETVFGAVISAVDLARVKSVLDTDPFGPPHPPR